MQKDIENISKLKSKESKKDQEYSPFDKRKHWNKVEYYSHQYGYKISNEEFYIVNKLTTPKENIMVKTTSVSYLTK